MKDLQLFVFAIILLMTNSLYGQIESFWYSDPDAVGFKEVDGSGGTSNASTWQPRLFNLSQELASTALFHSITPSDFIIAETGGAGPIHLTRHTHSSLVFDYESVHRSFLDINGLELFNDEGIRSLKAFTSGDAGRIELFTGTGSSGWLARIGPTETGINRGSLRLYGSDGFEKVEFTVDSDNEPIIEAGKGMSIKSSDDLTPDLILRGNNSGSTNGTISSDPDYTNSNLIFNTNGSVSFDLDIDNNGGGFHTFKVNGDDVTFETGANLGTIVKRLSSLVEDPHLSIRDVAGNSYGRLNIGNGIMQSWQIAGKPSGTSTQKYLLFHLTDTDGTAGDDMMQLRGDGNLYVRGSYLPISDIRLKKDIIRVKGSLDNITKLNGYNYNWKDPKKMDPQTGVIAQEVQKVFPRLVSENKNGDLSVNYNGLIPHLIESIKELKIEIEELKKQNR